MGFLGMCLVKIWKACLRMADRPSEKVMQLRELTGPEAARERGDIQWFWRRITQEDLCSWTTEIKGLTHTISDRESHAVTALLMAQAQGDDDASYHWKRALLIWVEHVSGHGRKWHHATPLLINQIEHYDPSRDWEIGRRVADGMIRQGWWESIPVEHLDRYALAMMTLLRRTAPSEGHHLVSIRIIEHLIQMIEAGKTLNRNLLAAQCSTCLHTWRTERWHWRIAHDVAVLSLCCGQTSGEVEDCLLCPVMLGKAEYVTHVHAIMQRVSRLYDTTFNSMGDPMKAALSRVLKRSAESGLVGISFPEYPTAITAIVRCALRSQDSQEPLVRGWERDVCDEIMTALGTEDIIADVEPQQRGLPCDLAVRVGIRTRVIAEAKVWRGPASTRHVFRDIVARQGDEVPCSVMLLFLKRERADHISELAAQALKTMPGFSYGGTGESVLGCVTHRLRSERDSRPYNIIVVPVELHRRRIVPKANQATNKRLKQKKRTPGK